MQPEREASRQIVILNRLGMSDEPPEVAESLFYLEALKKVESMSRAWKSVICSLKIPRKYDGSYQLYSNRRIIKRKLRRRNGERIWQMI